MWMAGTVPHLRERPRWPGNRQQPAPTNRKNKIAIRFEAIPRKQWLQHLESIPPLQDGNIVNAPKANRLFAEVGDEWLNELTPDEKAVATKVHREWFAPGLTLRHSNIVWV
jgi:hypothetical protein